MDFSAYLLNGVVESTTPPGETAANAQSRREAIDEMFKAFDPSNPMQAMIASHCVALQFLLNAAMRDASNINLEPAVLTRARAGAVAISKTLHQWVTRLEKFKQRDEIRAKEARQSNQTIAAATAPKPEPVATAPQPPKPPLNQAGPDSSSTKSPVPPVFHPALPTTDAPAAALSTGGRPPGQTDAPAGKVAARVAA